MNQLKPITDEQLDWLRTLVYDALSGDLPSQEDRDELTELERILADSVEVEE